MFSADEAKTHGFVTKIFEDQKSLYEGAFDLAKTIASKSPVAIVGTKSSMNYSLDHSVHDGLNHIKIMNSGLLQSTDLMTAAMASLSKQVPTFAKL